jgi:hypothetical protein
MRLLIANLIERWAEWQRRREERFALHFVERLRAVERYQEHER